MKLVDFDPRTRIIFGPGQISRLGELAAELGATRAMVVTDPGIEKAGHTQRGVEALQASGLTIDLFDGVEENPTTVHVDRAVERAREFAPDLLVGIGGGSAMDCAKGVNFVFSGGGRIQDYWGVGKATKPMLPMIAVPTTAGTGSEAQSFALISDPETHVKMACGDKKAACRIALLDPELTATQSPAVTALTGIDAIAHAVETYVTNKRNPVSLAFSREAWRLLNANFERVLENPEDIQARGGMQLGACFSGMAIENSMLGATHALANPLTARYGITHGQAIAIMLPHVVRFNGEEVNDWYRELIEAGESNNGTLSPDGGANALAHHLVTLTQHAKLATRLSDCGVSEQSLPEMATEAAKQWTGSFNPRRVEMPALLDLYLAAL